MAVIINKHDKIKANGKPVYEGIRVDDKLFGGQPKRYGFKIQGHVVYLSREEIEMIHDSAMVNPTAIAV